MRCSVMCCFCRCRLALCWPMLSGAEWCCAMCCCGSSLCVVLPCAVVSGCVLCCLVRAVVLVHCEPLSSSCVFEGILPAFCCAALIRPLCRAVLRGAVRCHPVLFVLCHVMVVSAGVCCSVWLPMAKCLAVPWLLCWGCCLCFWPLFFTCIFGAVSLLCGCGPCVLRCDAFWISVVWFRGPLLPRGRSLASCCELGGAVGFSLQFLPSVLCQSRRRFLISLPRHCCTLI